MLIESDRYEYLEWPGSTLFDAKCKAARLGEHVEAFTVEAFKIVFWRKEDECDSISPLLIEQVKSFLYK